LDLSAFKNIIVINWKFYFESNVWICVFVRCVTKKTQADIDIPFESDGIIGMGNYKKTLAYQWFQKKIISQNMLGFCIAKALE